MPDPFEIFITTAPGLEPQLAEEVQEKGFGAAQQGPGGVTITGGWPEIWRANLELRGASRVLARLGSFRAMHPAQLDKRARKFPWAEVLRPDVPVRVEATCKASRIYHAGAARSRVARAIAEELGAPVTEDAALRILVRIEDDLCTLSVDTSGAPLHQRGYKQAVGKAPMRENMAALFLRVCGYDGAEPVVDPMCGSGTFLIEAAEMAAKLQPGRSRSFAFEQLTTFDNAAWQALHRAGGASGARFYGSDRDAGAIKGATENAARAGVADWCDFQIHALSDLPRPDGPPGLILTNPPYGGRVGNKKPLFALYDALGRVLRERFTGWRVGIITSDAGLARATGLTLDQGPVVAHGGLKIRLYQAVLN